MIRRIIGVVLWIAGGVPLLLFLQEGKTAAFLCYIGGVISYVGCDLATGDKS